MEEEVRRLTSAFLDNMVKISLEEIEETCEAYKNDLQSLEEIVDDAKAIVEQMDREQGKILLDCYERKDILEWEKGICLYLAGIKDGVRLAKYLDINRYDRKGD